MALKTRCAISDSGICRCLLRSEDETTEFFDLCLCA